MLFPASSRLHFRPARLLSLTDPLSRRRRHAPSLHAIDGRRRFGRDVDSYAGQVREVFEERGDLGFQLAVPVFGSTAGEFEDVRATSGHQPMITGWRSPNSRTVQPSSL